MRDLITFEDLKNKPDIYNGNRGMLTLCNNSNDEIKELSIYIELPYVNANNSCSCNSGLSAWGNSNYEINEFSINKNSSVSNCEIELDDLSICFESLFSINKESEKTDNNYYKIYKKSTYTKLTAYDHLKYGAEELSVYIGFPVNSEFKYIKDINLYTQNEARVIKHNIIEIMNLIVSTPDINSADIKRNIIDEFNNNKLILFTYSNKLKYTKIEEIANLIFNINNELYKLGKTIKLYNVENTDDRGNVNINDLQYINLGEKELSIELQQDNQRFANSIILKWLTFRLIGGPCLAYRESKEIHRINTNDKNFPCKKCFTAEKEYSNLCNTCVINDKYRVIINDVY